MCFGKAAYDALLRTGMVLVPLLSPLTISADDRAFPYEAVVVVDQAAVRSGPGDVHYPTDHLEKGTIVEVYRHDPGGWAAIRPPEGSFSLVSAADVQRVGDSLAKVVGSDARAWVGTRLSAVDQPMWQVRLDPGELLEVLGVVDRDQYNLQEDEPDWIQIAPPAGEFRWMRQADLQFRGPLVDPSVQSDSANQLNPVATEHSVLGNATMDEPEAAQPKKLSDVWLNESVDHPDGTRSASQASDWSEDSPAMNQKSVENTGWKPAKRPIASLVGQGSQFFADERFGQPTTNWSLQSPGPPPQLPDMTTQQPAGSYSAPPTTLTQQPSMHATLDQLELQLTAEMVKSPQQWNLQYLAQQAKLLQSQASDAQIQARVATLLNKIQRCREIQAGLQAVNQAAAGRAPRASGSVTGGSPMPQLVDATPTGSGIRLDGGPVRGSGNYDAVGWLNELVRDGGMQPSSYVLQNDKGEITYHVAPAPGVNLHRYLKQRVAVIGTRGFDQQLHLDYVAAERVIPLDHTLR